jgi:hypothetical protein
MTTPDERLAALVSDAVADIEPADHLDAIRARTQETPMKARRPWFIATGGAVLATAAVITAIAFATNQDTTSTERPEPGTSPTGAVDPSDSPQPSETPYPIYYLGDTPSGPRLYRELRQVPGVNHLQGVAELLTSAPADPDYRTPWPVGAFASVHFDGTGADGVIGVVLADASLHDRPAGMSRAEAAAAIQQVVYTMQATVGERAAVQFFYNGNPIDQVLGEPTAEPLANASQLATLAHVSITNPAENAAVSGSFHALGVANSFEANVGWQIRQGEATVLGGSFMADGWMGDRLFPWEGTVDVSQLEPGTYTFVVSEDDPSGGEEGNGPDTDTRTIVVE